jgi:hypothetical protein
MKTIPQWFDRELQRQLLQLLVDAYPHALTPQQMGHDAGDRELVGNLAYLGEHDLIEVVLLSGTHGQFVGGAAATVKGAEFLQAAGSAIGCVGGAQGAEEGVALAAEAAVLDRIRLSLSEDGRGNVEIHSVATGTSMLLPLADVELLKASLPIPHRTGSAPETLSLDPTS